MVGSCARLAGLSDLLPLLCVRRVIGKAGRDNLTAFILLPKVEAFRQASVLIFAEPASLCKFPGT